MLLVVSIGSITCPRQLSRNFKAVVPIAATNSSLNSLVSVHPQAIVRFLIDSETSKLRLNDDSLETANIPTTHHELAQKTASRFKIATPAPVTSSSHITTAVLQHQETVSRNSDYSYVVNWQVNSVLYLFYVCRYLHGGIDTTRPTVSVGLPSLRKVLECTCTLVREKIT